MYIQPPGRGNRLESVSQCLCIVCCIVSLPIFCAKVRLYWICVGACGGGVFNPAPLTDDTSSIIGAPLRIFICPPLICLDSKVVCRVSAGPQQGGLSPILLPRESWKRESPEVKWSR